MPAVAATPFVRFPGSLKPWPVELRAQLPVPRSQQACGRKLCLCRVGCAVASATCLVSSVSCFG